MSEFTVAKILKHLALILEENNFVIYHDKRFPSMKPHINDSTLTTHKRIYKNRWSLFARVENTYELTAETSRL